MELKFDNNDIYLYRNLIESQSFNQAFRENIAQSEKYRDEWFLTKKKSDFGIFNESSTHQELKSVS